MCGGGGGGGDGGAAEREAERQKEQDEAIDRINTLFGMGGDVELTAPSRENTKYQTMPSFGRGTNSDIGAVGMVFNETKYQQDLDAYNAAVKQRDDARANRTSLDDMYSGIGNDVSDYLTDDLNDQYETAERSGRFATARRGVRGGSSELDLIDNQQESFDKGVLEVSNRADGASNAMRSSDAKTRLDMTQRILSGMSGDAAFASAQQSMMDNSDEIRRQSLAQSLDNVFGDVSFANQQDAVRRGTQRANDYYGTYYPSSNKSYYGSNG